MSDFGELPWISKTIETLAEIGSILRRYRKLQAKMLEIMKGLNANLRGMNSKGSTEQCQQRQETGKQKESDNTAESIAVIYITGSAGDLEKEDPPTSGPDLIIDADSAAVPLTKTMKRVFVVRFALGEQLPDEFISILPFL